MKFIVESSPEVSFATIGAFLFHNRPGMAQSHSIKIMLYNHVGSKRGWQPNRRWFSSKSKYAIEPVRTFYVDTGHHPNLTSVFVTFIFISAYLQYISLSSWGAGAHTWHISFYSSFSLSFHFLVPLPFTKKSMSLFLLSFILFFIYALSFSYKRNHAVFKLNCLIYFT